MTAADPRTARRTPRGLRESDTEAFAVSEMGARHDFRSRLDGRHSLGTGRRAVVRAGGVQPIPGHRVEPRPSRRAAGSDGVVISPAHRRPFAELPGVVTEIA